VTVVTADVAGGGALPRHPAFVTAAKQRMAVLLVVLSLCIARLHDGASEL
jgi:hypothetical protein